MNIEYLGGMRRIACCLCVLCVIVCSCREEYNDTELWNDLEDVKHRVQLLEEFCKEVNTNISSLQVLMTALQQNDYITDVIPIMSEDEKIGYTINFVRHDPITIYHGKNGVSGNDGKTPVISVDKSDDGLYYWMLNGKWMLDNEGYKILVQGTDGVTPKLKIQDNFWYVSYDNGFSWVNLGKVLDLDESIFENVDITNEHFVVFQLSNGMTVSLPKYQSIDILFEDVEDIVIAPNVLLEIPYRLIGVGTNAQLVAIASDGIDVKVSANNSNEGILQIVSTKEINEFSRVVVFVSYSGYTIVRALTFTSGIINVTSEVYEVSHTGGLVTIPIETNIDYVYSIENEAQDWIHPAQNQTRNLHIDNVPFVVSENTGGIRSATIIFSNEEKTIQRQVVILQNSKENSTGAFMEINDDEAIIYMNKAADAASVAKAIREADNKGVTKYVMKGAYEKLGFTYAAYNNVTNPFKNAPNVEAIDFQGVTGWTEISEYVFTAYEENLPVKYYTSLEQIILPDNVSEIGYKAFEGCSSLRSINLSNVTRIGSYAFRECALTSLDLPNLIELFEGSFSGCPLISVSLPNLKEIKFQTFSGCSSLKSINLPNVTTIEGSAFDRCTSLVSVSFPKVEIIENSSVFANCTSLISVDLPAATIIGGRTFESCSSLTEINLPKAKFVGVSAFQSCSSLSYINLSNVETIEEGCFGMCSALASIDLSCATKIGNNAFRACTTLTSIDAPNVVTIGNYTFAYCSRLVELRLTTSNGINDIGQSWISSNNVQLYLNVNKMPEVEEENMWKGLKWKSIHFVSD